MRALRKGPVPHILLTTGQRRRDEYVAAHNRGDRPLPTPWRHDQIREGLEDETSGRCAYCDGDIHSIAFGDIEHIRPRAAFPEYVVDWENLTLACPKCNNSKRDKWDENLPYISPYDDEINDHIVFVGPFLRGVSARGMKTVLDVDLNDLAKAEARQRQIDSVVSLYAHWFQADATAKEVHRAQIIMFLATTPYYASVAAFLRSVGFPLSVAV